MDKKKILKYVIGALVVILIIVLIIVLVNKRVDTSDEKIPYEPINVHVNLEQVFAEVSKIDGMQTYEMEVVSGEEMLENTDETQDKKIIPEEEIDFGRFAGLEKKAIVNTTDEQINEVWMVKLGDMSQQEEVSRIFGNRIQKLRNAFEGNEVQLAILNKAIIKQEGAIIIMIAGSEAKTVEETIANAMK